MRYTLTIALDNAAFDPEAGQEVARILREAADKVALQPQPGRPEGYPLRDMNGNTVGHHGFTLEGPEDE